MNGSSLSYMLLAAVGGVSLAIQLGVNAGLARYIGGSVNASFISFAIGTLALLPVVLFFSAPSGANPGLTQGVHGGWSALGGLSSTPWPWLLGGVLGALYVCSVVSAVPHIGPPLTIAIIIFAQLFTAVIIEHYGLLGFQQHLVNLPRLLGIGMLLGGVVLIRFN